MLKNKCNKTIACDVTESSLKIVKITGIVMSRIPVMHLGVKRCPYGRRRAERSRSASSIRELNISRYQFFIVVGWACLWSWGCNLNVVDDFWEKGISIQIYQPSLDLNAITIMMPISSIRANAEQLALSQIRWLITHSTESNTVCIFVYVTIRFVNPYVE